MAAKRNSTRKRPYPRPDDPGVFEDGSFNTVGGWGFDPDTGKMSRTVKPRKKTVGRKKK